MSGRQLVVQTEVVGVAVFFVEVVEGVASAQWPVVGLAAVADGACGFQQSFDVAGVHDEAGVVGDRLHASSRPVGDHGCAAGDGFEVDGGIVVLPGGVDEGIGHGVEFGQLSGVLRPSDADDAGWQSLTVFLCDAYEDDHLVVVQLSAHAYEVVQSFFFAPDAGHAEQDVLPSEAVPVADLLRGAGLEDGGVDAVVDHAEVIAAEERPLHLVADPLRHGHDDELVFRHRGERCLLVGIVACAAVAQPAGGKLVLLWAVVAAGLPAVTAGIGVVVAVSGVEPAVVHGPHHGDAAARQVVEQHPVVEEVSVYVVYVDDVGPEPLDLVHEAAGGLRRAQSVAVEQAGLQSVECYAPSVAYGEGVRGAALQAVASLAVGHIALPSVLHRQLADLLHDAAGGGGGPQDGVDLKKSFHCLVSEVKRCSHWAMTASSE